MHLWPSNWDDSSSGFVQARRGDALRCKSRAGANCCHDALGLRSAALPVPQTLARPMHPSLSPALCSAGSGSTLLMPPHTTGGCRCCWRSLACGAVAPRGHRCRQQIGRGVQGRHEEMRLHPGASTVPPSAPPALQIQRDANYSQIYQELAAVSRGEPPPAASMPAQQQAEESSKANIIAQKLVKYVPTATCSPFHLPSHAHPCGPHAERRLRGGHQGRHVLAVVR